jgi:polysaccharide deacetylase family protein (PEP-CTERM system associated)
MSVPFLFSVDLEDLCTQPGGEQFEPRVPQNTARWLAFLEEHDARCTFFTVGDVARRYPELVREIRDRGHEVGCHSSDHRTLDRHDAASFREDCLRSLDDLASAGVEGVVGYRAPTLSLTEDREWVFEVLSELGFLYSSSVLPAASPLYGWAGFGRAPRRVDGLWELPVSVSALPLLDVPFAAGIYFRVLPFPLVRRLVRRELADERPVVAYFHPYDIDTEQRRGMHPGIRGNRLYNWLMYRNRHRVLPRLARLLAAGARIQTYAAFVEEHLEPPSAA